MIHTMVAACPKTNDFISLRSKRLPLKYISLQVGNQTKTLVDAGANGMVYDDGYSKDVQGYLAGG